MWMDGDVAALCRRSGGVSFRGGEIHDERHNCCCGADLDATMLRYYLNFFSDLYMGQELICQLEVSRFL